MRHLLLTAAFALALSCACGTRDVVTGSPGAPDGGDAGTTLDAATPDASTPDAGPAKEYPYYATEGDELRLFNETFTVVVNLKTGYFDVYRGTDLVVKRARSEAVTADGTTHSTADRGYTRTVGSDSSVPGVLAVSVESAATGLPEITQAFTLERGSPAFTLDVSIRNTASAALAIKKIVPAVARDAAGGALFIGADPAHHRILENGSDAYLDFYVHLLPGDAPRNGMSDLFPWEAEGNSVANLVHTIHDLDAKRTFLAGFLTSARMIPLATVAFDAAKARTDGATGRKGFTHWGIECPFIPVNIALAQGASLAAETVYVDAAAGNPLDALERYADAIAKRQQITLWTKRTDPATGKPYGVPNGWNSWSGGGGSGGYGQDINEDLIDRNVDFMAREFQPFGIDWFQIDDGWQIDYGDWTLNKTCFPDHGAEDSFTVLTRKMNSLGMKPGLWIGALSVHKESQVYQAHPDWFAKKDAFGNLSASDNLVFDLTLDGPLQFLDETFTRLNGWGFRWTKLDFAYWTMAVQQLKEPNVTPVEAYRRGLRRIRDTLGPDRHLLIVAGIGPAIGIGDSNRITLDNMPVWDGRKSIDDFSDQGLKPTYRTVARRYWLSHRVWINHPDLIFFRADPEHTVPPLTLDESRAFCSIVSLTGGIVKIGERLLEMRPEWIDTVRRLLPAWPATGRPLDLFTREFPEVWHLPLKGAPSGAYDVVGLINWGVNKDLTTNPYTMMPDSARTFTIDAAAIGLDPAAEYLAFEFWDQRLLGTLKGTLAVEVPAHRAYVISLRKREDHPQFLGTNRHILMGAVGVDSMAWDDTKKTLTVRQEAVPGTTFAPFSHQASFSVPDGWAVADYSVSGLDKTAVALTTNPSLGTLTFAATEKGEVEWQVTFTGP